MPNPSESITTLIVAGFLGAGKTTFIRDLLPLVADSDWKPHVILNDHQNAEIDAVTLRGLGAEVRGISAACICCDDPNALIEAILGIPPCDKSLLIIEANGSADPYRLIEVLTLTPGIRNRIGLIRQITLLNESRWGKRTHPGDSALERAQVRTASVILKNRGELATVSQRQKVVDDLSLLNPAARQLDFSGLVGEVLRPCSAISLPAPDTSSGTDHRHYHMAVRMVMPSMSEEHLRQWLVSLPQDVLRVKGVVQISDQQICYFNRTDDPFVSPSLHRSILPIDFKSGVVFIGHGLSERFLRGSLEITPKVTEFKL